jgi:Ni2+-binding GTPase involved in maturation of urease and hydrogenase
MDVDPNKLMADVKKINPNASVAFTNCRTGEGVDAVVEALGF